MYVTSCAKNILTICIMALMFILSMAGSAAATPITITVPGNLPSPIAAFPVSVPSSKHLIATEDDMRVSLVDAASSDFMTWTFAVTAPPKPRLSNLPFGRRHRVFETSQHTPGVLRTTRVLLYPHVDALAEMKLPAFSCFDDLSGSFLGEDVRFPLPSYRDVSFPSAQLPVPPAISVPEPDTLVLFTAALGGIFGYALWRHRKHGSVQLTSSPERSSETFQSYTEYGNHSGWCHPDEAGVSEFGLQCPRRHA